MSRPVNQGLKIHFCLSTVRNSADVQQLAPTNRIATSNIVCLFITVPFSPIKFRLSTARDIHNPTILDFLCRR